ncbi:MAG: radical SAM protein [Proteobacteria bacterium]|nr:radical SAM protein [Pseudomonadota bacterium]
MRISEPEGYIIESGPMGPIGEGEALILRVNRNCPWNRCLFCPAYKDRKFGKRSVDEVKKDIRTVGRIADLLEETSEKLGLSGKITHQVLYQIRADNPHVYGQDSAGTRGEAGNAVSSLNNVANWLFHGGRRVFLQDADAMATKPSELAQMLRYLKERFETVETVTCYARSKSCSRRSAEEFEDLKAAGLSCCFVGIESGCDRTLEFMKKGVTRADHLDSGLKLKESGIHCAAFVMPGLAGGDKNRSETHLEETLSLLNRIQPREIRIRSLAVLEDSLLYRRYLSGDFEPARENRMIQEIRSLLEGLEFDCIFETYQMTNVLFNVREKLRDVRDDLRTKIERYQSLNALEQARLRLNKFLHGGYVGFVKRIGKYDASLEKRIDEALDSLERESADAVAKTETAIFAIKAKAVP